MRLITSKPELEANIETLRQYLRGQDIDHDFAVELIRSGTCFVITEHGGTGFFAPSRFVGYERNSRHDHVTNDDKDGRDTNAAIAQVLEAHPTPNPVLEQEYERFVVSLGASPRKAPFGNDRKFWDLR